MRSPCCREFSHIESVFVPTPFLLVASRAVLTALLSSLIEPDEAAITVVLTGADLSVLNEGCLTCCVEKADNENMESASTRSADGLVTVAMNAINHTVIGFLFILLSNYTLLAGSAGGFSEIEQDFALPCFAA